jgi:ferrous iron transport protein B
MAPGPVEKAVHVALVGNPNTGKSTLFSALVGIHQRVGNYPGVTVEEKTGRLEHAGRRFELVDLPGLYSLGPRSRDEMVAVDVLLGRFQGSVPIDAVICVADAANLQRSLYLVSQVLDLGLPTVLALNMVDVAEARKIAIDAKRLHERLGIAVVPMQANRGLGLAELRDALARAVEGPPPAVATPFPGAFDEEVDRLAGCFPEPLPRWLIARLLLDVAGHLRRAILGEFDASAANSIDDARSRLTGAGLAVPGLETEARYRWARGVLDGVLTEPKRFALTATDRVDRVLTHRVWGTVILAAVMVIVFQAVFVGAEPLMAGIDAAVRFCGGLIESRMPEGAVRSLLVDGVLAGVGNILTFFPQILVLFAFLAVLEDCGYLARAACLMDGLMARAGLSGKSFIPLLSSFACAVPGIMAARVVDDERDRLTTILVAPLMTCSARLPVYALLISAFIPREAYLGGVLGLQGLTLAALYALGIATAVVAARVLKGTVLRGQTPPFLMELPSYKWPSLRTVAMRVVERAIVFVRFAGTMILAVSILLWAAMYYPHDREAAYPRQSYLARFGRLIEPVFRPLGWDWRIGSAVIASFPAREIVVATLGVVFNAGGEADTKAQDDAPRLSAHLRAATWEDSGKPLFGVPVALSILVFYALCAQCTATLAAIRRETNSWRWPAFAFAYMTSLAYLAALVTYQVGTWLGGPR